MSTGCSGASRQRLCEASLNPLYTAQQGQAGTQALMYSILVTPIPMSCHLCMTWLLNERIVITWQVYEGAPGRGAAVRDGEGHSVDLRGQVRDI